MTEKAEISRSARSFLQRLTGLSHRVPKVFTPRQAFNERTGKYLAVKLEVADDAYARGKGLLGREELAPGSGLWIYPCESVHTFAMRFAIDLVYLDRKCVVKKARPRVPPGRISACLSARSVLELPAGTIEATGTMPGDRIAITSRDSTEEGQAGDSKSEQ